MDNHECDNTAAVDREIAGLRLDASKFVRFLTRDKAKSLHRVEGFPALMLDDLTVRQGQEDPADGVNATEDAFLAKTSAQSPTQTSVNPHPVTRRIVYGFDRLAPLDDRLSQGVAPGDISGDMHTLDCELCAVVCSA